MEGILSKTAAAALITFAVCSPAAAIPVDLELILLTDNSGSIDTTDFDLMRYGYAAAFQSSALQTAISQGAHGKIVVTLVEFSDGVQQTVGWTLIEDAASANAFASAVTAAPRASSGSTGIVNAMNFSVPLFDGNGFEGTRRAIDLAGDGAESSQHCAHTEMNCIPLQNARGAALAAGVTTINALWIDDRDFFGDDPEDIIDAFTYGTTNVIGGANPFQLIIDDFSDFAPAILSKLQREVTGGGDVPEPGVLALLGLGLIGLGLGHRGSRSVGWCLNPSCSDKRHTG